MTPVQRRLGLIGGGEWHDRLRFIQSSQAPAAQDAEAALFVRCGVLASQLVNRQDQHPVGSWMLKLLRSILRALVIVPKGKHQLLCPHAQF
jgi:hypothetical protein